MQAHTYNKKNKI